MAYLVVRGKKQSISNWGNMDKRCSCDANYYTLLMNPIYIVLRAGKKPTVFKSRTNEAYSERKNLGGRAISFNGCVCEMDIISKNYRVFGAMRPSQYNWGTSEICKETGKKKYGILPSEKSTKWGK